MVDIEDLTNCNIDSNTVQRLSLVRIGNRWPSMTHPFALKVSLLGVLGACFLRTLPEQWTGDWNGWHP